MTQKHQCNLKSKINFSGTQINQIEELDSNEMGMNKKRAIEAELCELYDKKVKVLKFVRGPDGCVKVKRIQNIFDLEKQYQCNNVIKELTNVDNRHVHTNMIY